MQDAPHADGFEYGLTPAFTLEKGQDKYTRSTPEIIVIPKNAEHPDEAKQFIRFLYTEAAVKAFAESGILHCTKNAVELTEGMFTEAFSSMHEVDSYAHALVFTWVPDADGSRIILHDEVYNPIADVMNGQMSAEDWVAAIEAAFHAANSGE